eukprot:3857147-Rhodomonas_salina.2
MEYKAVDDRQKEGGAEDSGDFELLRTGCAMASTSTAYGAALPSTGADSAAAYYPTREEMELDGFDFKILTQ